MLEMKCLTVDSAQTAIFRGECNPFGGGCWPDLGGSGCAPDCNPTDPPMCTPDDPDCYPA